jgi:hypothetical protein
MFSLANFRARPAAQLTRRQHLCAPDRSRPVDQDRALDAATGIAYNGDPARKSRQTSLAAYIQDAGASPTSTLVGEGMGCVSSVHAGRCDALARHARGSLRISGVVRPWRPGNLFQPGVLAGRQPSYTLFEPGTPAYKANYRDFAPNAGVAWRPNVQGGWLRTMLGDPEQATIRAGYAMSFNQERIDRFENNATDNPGGTVNVVRNNTTGYPLVRTGENHPVLFREKSRLGPPDFPVRPEYPILPTTANNVNIFPDRLRTPRVHSYSVGFQRSVGADTAVEVRYVGNRNRHAWAEENWNERNVLTTGFLDEFRVAQANLRAHVTSGCGTTANPCSFAYRGPGTGTAPLPIHLAYLNGRTDAGTAAAYTSTSFTNLAFLARFSEYEPNARAAVNALDTTALRPNALAAGLPVNFFMLNPAVGGAFIVQDKTRTQFDSAQIDVRRRLSRGLLLSGSYTYGIRKGTLNPGPTAVAQGTVNTSVFRDRLMVDQTDVPHAYKLNWYYDVPVGRGRFGGEMHPVLNGTSETGSFQAARFQQRVCATNVKLEGMMVSDLQDMFKIRVAGPGAESDAGVQLPAGHRQYACRVQHRSDQSDWL